MSINSFELAAADKLLKSLGAYQGALVVTATPSGPRISNTYRKFAGTLILDAQELLDAGYMPGFERDMWDKYRAEKPVAKLPAEKAQRRARIETQDWHVELRTADWKREDDSLRIVENCVREGDACPLDGSLADEEAWFTNDWGFKNQELETDDELMAMWGGDAQAYTQSRMDMMRDHIATAHRYNYPVSRVTGADFKYAERMYEFRNEFERIRSKASMSLVERNHAERITASDFAYDAIEALGKASDDASARYEAMRRIYRNTKRMLAQAAPRDVAKLQQELIRIDGLMTKERRNESVAAQLAEAIERELNTLSFGCTEYVNFEHCKWNVSDVIDRFADQFELREDRGADDIGQRESKAPRYNAESMSVEQRLIHETLGYCDADDFIDNMFE